MVCLRRFIQSSAHISLGATKKAWEVHLMLLYLKGLSLERNVFRLFCVTLEDGGRTPRSTES